MLQTQLPMQAYMPVRKAKCKAFWIKKRHFLRIAEISEKRFDKNKSKYATHSAKWNCEKRDGIIYIDVNSIPNRADYIKYPDDVVLEMVKQLEVEDQENKYDNHTEAAKISQVRSSMFLAAGNYHAHYNYINDKYNLNKEKCKLFAQRWAVWVWINEHYSREKNNLAVFHAAYNLTFPGHLSDTKSFCNFKKGIDESSIEAKVIDQRAVVKVAERITPFQHAALEKLYIQPQKILAPAAHIQLIKVCKEVGEKPYSLASVKKYFKKFEHNIELYRLRYGAAAAQKQMVHTTTIPALHRNTQWPADGWTLPFCGANFQRYVLYIVRDAHSRKIIGYSVGESENSTIVLEALEDAVRNTGVLPAELLTDKHSWLKAQERLLTEMDKMGVIITTTTNAQRNAIAERYNQYFDPRCREIAGYTGKNMTATGKDSRPGPEAITEITKPKHFKTIAEIKTIAAYLVLEFNNEQLTALNNLTPNEAYAASNDEKCFLISEAERVKLFRPVMAYKVHRGQITIKVGVRKHEFQLPAELINRYNSRDMEVAYEDLLQGIYVSDPKTGEAMGFIAPKYTPHGAIADQTEEDKKAFKKLAGRGNGVTVKDRKSAQATIAAGLAHNPEALDIINSIGMPKDIRQIATQNRELKRAMDDQGVKYDMLPIRDYKAVEIIPEVKQKPVVKKPGSMEKLSIDYFINR